MRLSVKVATTSFVWDIIVRIEVQVYHNYEILFKHGWSNSVFGRVCYNGFMSNESFIREELVFLLRKGNAHMPFEEAVLNFPIRHINTKPKNISYTFWHLVEHIRLTQWDIIDFTQNPNYKEPKWPHDYWPEKDAIATKISWDRSVKQVLKDLDEMVGIVRNPKTDLFAKIPHGNGQTILREALVIADHNAYHVGELAILRQVMNAWPKGRGPT